MAILDKVRAIFKTTKPPTTAQEHSEPQRVGDLYGKFTAETTRAGVVRKCREMYANDSRARKMLRVLARDLVKGGFTLKCDDAQALEIAEALRIRLSLDQRMDDWVRLTARDGDSFLELAVDSQLLIADVSRKPTLEMHRDSNSQDTFDNPEKAFWWADEIWTGQAAPLDAIWFADWQIIHARWEHDEGSRYGSPMMSSGVTAWKRVTEGELDIAVRRKTRAGKKYVHKFPPETSPATIASYRTENKDALDNPFAAVADYFGTVDITSIEGDAHLAEIADVLHHISTWFTSGEVPMELIAYGENLNRDVLEEKKAEYDETLEQLREWVTTELVKPLLERQWLLQSIYPPSLTYSIEWKQKRMTTPQDMAAVANALTAYYNANVTLKATGIGDGRYAPSFNGTNSVINLWSAALNTAFSGAAGSMMFWAKVSGASVWTGANFLRIVQIRVNDNNKVDVIRWGGENNALICEYKAGGITKAVYPYVGPTTAWFNVILTWSKAADQLKVYINGVQSGTTQIGLGTWAGNLDNWTTVIGAGDATPYGDVWSGFIAHVALWNTVLTPTQIAAITTV